jgi:hypothetical protein
MEKEAIPAYFSFLLYCLFPGMSTAAAGKKSQKAGVRRMGRVPAF